MSKAKNIPAKLTDFSVFRDGSNYVGVADATLPQLALLTSTITGAGISGEIDAPSPGQYSSMELTLNFNTFTDEYFALVDGKYHLIDLRTAQEQFNTATSNLDLDGYRVTVKAAPKTADLGTLQKNNPIGNNITFEVIYLKIVKGSTRIIEIDKLNGINFINGNDSGQKIRDLLGL